jgi:hypothetical protein
MAAALARHDALMRAPRRLAFVLRDVVVSGRIALNR